MSEPVLRFLKEYREEVGNILIDCFLNYREVVLNEEREDLEKNRLILLDPDYYQTETIDSLESTKTEEFLESLEDFVHSTMG